MAAALKKLVTPIYRKAVDLLSPRAHIILNFLRFHNRWPNIDDPKGFNEKIAWRKLYDRNPRLTELVDKVKAKEYVAKHFGEKYVIPTLAVYKSAAELDFTTPPLNNPPYMLKVNNGSGYNVFIKDKSFNPEAVRKKLDGFMKIDYHNLMEEWAYLDVPRRILVEPYIETPEGYIPDYKCHVFNGRLFAIEMIIDRFKSYNINFFDRDWKQIDIRKYARRPAYNGAVQKPKNFDEMKQLAEGLGRDFDYARVDLYEIAGEVKFGEMTFYPGGGHDRFDPPEWEEKFGSQWQRDWSAGKARG